jgi:hypothetical protein
VRPEQRQQIALGHVQGQVAHPERVRLRAPRSGAALSPDGVLRRGARAGAGRLGGLRGRRLRRHRRSGVEGTLEHGEFGLDLHASTRALESGLWTVGLGDSVRTYSEHKCVRVEPGVIVYFDRTRPTPTIAKPT